MNQSLVNWKDKRERPIDGFKERAWKATSKKVWRGQIRKQSEGSEKLIGGDKSWDGAMIKN